MARSYYLDGIVDIASIKQLVWVIYGISAFGMLLGIANIFKSRSSGLRNILVCSCLGLLVIVWPVSADTDVLAPAFMVALFDGLTQGPQAALRAGTPLLLGSLFIILIGQVAGLLLDTKLIKGVTRKRS
jgi:hypothetical protein